MMEENPFSKSTQPIFFEERNDRCRCLSEEEIRKLLAACPAYLRNIVQVALLTGLRKNDLLRLKWSDIGLERRILYFKEQKKRSKRGGQRIKRRPGRSAEEDRSEWERVCLQRAEWKAPQGCEEGLQDGLEEGRDRRFPLSRSVPRLRASYLVMRGASMKSVQEHLGYTSLAMTERYSHLSPEYMGSEVERLNGLCMVGMDEADSIEMSKKCPDGQPSTTT